jgi:hypothetical protein
MAWKRRLKGADDWFGIIFNHRVTESEKEDTERINASGFLSLG